MLVVQLLLHPPIVGLHARVHTTLMPDNIHPNPNTIMVLDPVQLNSIANDNDMVGSS